ncbi:hypothetical protein, partial [Proteus mirabilis]|uniref:hypothetical protein n=1 Tax=Proteus mirabilis TaxID=584 RepID=UPI0023602272
SDMSQRLLICEPGLSVPTLNVIVKFEISLAPLGILDIDQRPHPIALSKRDRAFDLRLSEFKRQIANRPVQTSDRSQLTPIRRRI